MSRGSAANETTRRCRRSRKRVRPWRDAHRETIALASFMVGCLIMGGTGRLGMLGYAGEDLVRQRVAEVMGG